MEPKPTRYSTEIGLPDLIQDFIVLKVSYNSLTAALLIGSHGRINNNKPLLRLRQSIKRIIFLKTKPFPPSSVLVHKRLLASNTACRVVSPWKRWKILEEVF